MDCYIFLVQEPSGTNILVSSQVLANPGSLVEYADGNIGRVESIEFFTAKQYDLLVKAVDVYDAEMLYMPNPIFADVPGNAK